MSDWHVLGLDGDPTPGDPDRTADLAGTLLHQAELADHNRTRLAAVARGGGDLGMQGDYAPKFREVLAELPGELGKLSTAYRGAGEALRSFASDLRAEKAKAATALRTGTDAATRYDGALREIRSLLPAGRELAVSPMLGVEASVEQATEGLDASVRSQARSAAQRAGQAERDKAAARRLAGDAARLRGEAEGRAVDGINRALDHSGIKNKSWWQKAWDVVSWPFQSWDNFVSFCRGAAFVVGIVALFISGPVGWALVGVALVAGAVAFGDTLVKFTQGKASLMDLALDALGLIPGTAGAIKLAGLGTRLAEAGPRLLAMARNLPETGRVVIGGLRGTRGTFGGIRGPIRYARALAAFGGDTGKLDAMIARFGGDVSRLEKGLAACGHDGEALERFIKVHPGAQGKHIPGHNNFTFGRSELTHPDPQALMDKSAFGGTTVRGTPGQPGFRERVSFDDVIGNHVDLKTEVKTPTSNAIIHYSSKGAHIVPGRP
jgi:hypothetical protein